MRTTGKHEYPDAGERGRGRPHKDGPHAATENGRSLKLLKTSETRYRRLFETAQDGVLLLDAETGQITDVNPFMVEMLGYPREHFLGRRLWEIGPVKDEEPSRRAFLQLQEKRYVRYEDLPLETFDSRRVQVEFVSNVYTVGDGEVIQCNIRDVSARKLAEAALRETSRKIAQLHQAAHQLETCENEKDIYRLAIDAAESILGFLTCSLYIVVGDKLVVKATSSEAVASVGQEIPLEGCGGGLAAETIRTGKASRFSSAEEAAKSCLGDPTLQSGISMPLNHLGVFQIRSDLRGAFTEEDTRLLELLAGYTAEALRRIRLQKELTEQATRDPVTGVYNRRYFTEVIAQEASRSERYAHSVGFLMIDVNRFKEVNDRFNHAMGDKVLQAMATVIQHNIRDADILVRYGGDEFLVILPEANGETDLVKERILAEVAERNKTNPLLDFPVTLAIGSTHWSSGNGQTMEQVLAETDRLMYEDKRRLSAST